ncbi:penicillin-binding protein activator [Altericroceibacterium xinjiangense]|uniref:penicillin-binding protein activator n=1 Tax=Altericroceibacterium xinjiangense TaxID=762261 RepID=UPI000F7DCF55|nr:penicillin-binding protein activator [Altericroceibacterium xinjiangense]
MVAVVKRGLAVAGLGLSLAACQVIPGGDRGPSAAPAPAPAPSATVAPGPVVAAPQSVALLVPLSGRNAEVGQSIANATAMALIDTKADNVAITTYDTGTGAGSAAARAISDGNKLILGPLLGDNVSAVLAQARPAGIPLIAFSNDRTVADRDVFVMGQIPEQSVARTVGYAVGQGSRRFAALVPDDEYGRRAEAALQAAAQTSGGQVVAVERYNRGNTSIVSAARRLQTKGGFDAVLIADGARLSAMGATELKKGGARPLILGTELWNGEASIANAPALRGALFSAVSDARYRQFVNSYETRFGAKPYRVATLGYDSVLLALRLARDWQPGQPFPLAQVADPEGFLGLDGPFRFRSDGVGERAMEVREVGNGTISVTDPAPEHFVN